MWSGNPEIIHVALIEKVRVLENELLLIKEDMKKQKYYIDLLLEKMDCISVDAELPIAKKVEI